MKILFSILLLTALDRHVASSGSNKNSNSGDIIGSGDIAHYTKITQNLSNIITQQTEFDTKLNHLVVDSITGRVSIFELYFIISVSLLKEGPKTG